jgi:hypothetical protein
MVVETMKKDFERILFWSFVCAVIIIVLSIVFVIVKSNNDVNVDREAFCTSHNYSYENELLGGYCYKIIMDTKITAMVNYCDSHESKFKNHTDKRVCFVGG